jgi:methylmalonyl-CoA/ethylmalonyl-CoA epimerase
MVQLIWKSDVSQSFERIEHVGIAVRSLDRSIPIFERLLGVPCYKIEDVIDQRVRTAFFDVGGVKVELLEPIGNEGPLTAFLEARGEGVHHLAFHVNSVTDAIHSLKSRGVRMLNSEGTPGADGLSIAFINPKSTGGLLVEVCGDK